jgi:hypothetical protein
MVASLRKAPPIALPAPRPVRLAVTFSAGSASASFVSQVIAERSGLVPISEVRREPVTVALDAYAEGAKKTVLRMPAGYNRSLTA